MGIQILSTFERQGVGNYPLIDDSDQRGGFQVVPDTATRDAIQSALRKEGMHVFVTASLSLFRLEADLVTWTPAVFTGGGGVNEGVYATTVGTAVRDIAYLSSSDTVEPADADDPGKQPVVGFVKDKPTTVTATVQYSGELSGFSGLTPGSTYFMSTTPGQITEVAPSALGSIVQRVGFAKNATTLVVMIDRDFVIL